LTAILDRVLEEYNQEYGHLEEAMKKAA